MQEKKWYENIDWYGVEEVCDILLSMVIARVETEEKHCRELSDEEMTRTYIDQSSDNKDTYYIKEIHDALRLWFHERFLCGDSG